jgi:uncharacterized protein YecT (DUF1311 family)
MRIIECTVVALLALIAYPVAAPAQDDKCPRGGSNDDCAQWYFERVDQALTAIVADRIKRRSEMTTLPESREAIRTTIEEAHRAWLVFRDAECKAYVAEGVMSARPEAGRSTSCRLSMTERRIEELKKF